MCKNLINSLYVASVMLLACFAISSCSSDSEGTPVTYSFDNGDTLIVYLDEVATLKVSAFMAIGDTVNIVWESSNTSVATVENGIVTPLKAGTTVIKATTAKGRTATCYITIKPRLVSSIKLTPRDTTLFHIGDTLTVKMKILPESATSKEVAWKSSDTKVATVSNNGFIRAIGYGTTKVSCTAKDGSKASDTLLINVSPIKVESITLNATSKSLYINETFQIEALVKPDDATSKDLLWTSSDESVVTVSQSGLVTAKSKGSAIITVAAKDESGVKATCNVTVSPILISGISLSETSIQIAPGESKSLTASIAPSNATVKDLVWSSSNAAVASVSSTGVVTALAVGNATITVASTDGSGKKATCQVKVAPILVKNISLNQSSLTIQDKETALLIATITPNNATTKDLKWSSSNTKVASVSSTGLVTATGIGSATITVTATDGSGVSSSCLINVTPKYVTSIYLNETSLTVTLGATKTLTATVLPDDATTKTLVWSSSNSNVATVSSSGIVTAKALGSATITAMATDGSNVKAMCTVNVKDPGEMVEPIVTSVSAMIMGSFSQITLGAGLQNNTDKSIIVKSVTVYNSNGQKIVTYGIQASDEEIPSGQSKTYGVGFKDATSVRLVWAYTYDGKSYSATQDWTYNRSKKYKSLPANLRQLR